MGKNIQIADTLHGNIKLMPLEKQIISTQIFNRLHNILQNSTVYLTFPCNRTKRFEHSIGTMELCGNIFMNGISNSDSLTLKKFLVQFEEVIDRIVQSMRQQSATYRQLIGDRNLEKKSEIIKSIYVKQGDSIYNTYNKFIPYNIPHGYVGYYIILFQAVRVAALLHDVGHPPFSHIVESALDEIYLKIKDKQDKSEEENEFIKIMDQYVGTGGQLHEEIGNIISERTLDSIIKPLDSKEVNQQDKVSYQLFKIMVKQVAVGILQEKEVLLKDIHGIIDGPLDGDRLDYVSRDPLNSGLNIGKIEYDRLISTMRIVEIDGNFFFAPSMKVIDTVEDFFHRRWNLYKQLIQHHRVIKTDYLLNSCVKELGLSQLNISHKQTDEVMGQALPYNISGIWKAIKNKESHETFFNSMIQWDDGWLLTILKKHYFENFKDESDSNPLKNKLEELLANNKHYYSVIKKPGDFVSIDDQIKKQVLDKKVELLEKLKQISVTKQEDKQEEKKVAFNIDPSINDLEKLFKSIEHEFENPLKEGFVLHRIFKSIKYLPKDGAKTVNELVDIGIKNCTEINKYDAIYEVKKIKSGLDKTLILYKENDGKLEIKEFNDISSQSLKLETEAELLPPFYLYIRKDEVDYVDYEKIRVELGRIIGEEIVKMLFTIFDAML